MNYNNKPSARDIANGIHQYEIDKSIAAYAAKGGQFSAEYSYFTYILHVAIAVVTGVIVSAFVGTILGVICGIASFIISLIIHWRRVDARHSLANYKESYIKRIILYTVITAAVIIGIKIAFHI